jgi:hypothetical protein
MDKDVPFGGKVVVIFSGDFRQNERVRRNGDSERDKEFTKFLLKIGDGEIPVCKAITPNSIIIPSEFT